MEAGTTLADALLEDLNDLSDNDAAADDDDDAEDGTDDNEHYSAKTSGEDTCLDDTNDNSKNPSLPQQSVLEDPEWLQFMETVRASLLVMNGGRGGAGGATDDDDVKAASGPTHSNTQTTEHHSHSSSLLLPAATRGLRRAADELMLAHDALVRAYHKKFPELAELIPDPQQYVQTVRCLPPDVSTELCWTTTTAFGFPDHNNTTTNTKRRRTVPDALDDFMTNHQILTVSVAGSTTAATHPLLSDADTHTVDRCASRVEALLHWRRTVTQFVAHTMAATAPNMHALVGATTAAHLVALAASSSGSGGLAALAKIPACNLALLGRHSSQKQQGGLKNMNTNSNGSVLAQCDLVQECPRFLQAKALKMVASKLALAIRCDFVGTNNNNTNPITATSGNNAAAAAGLSFRAQIQAKFALWQEPEKAPVLKSLPKPDLTIKKRRGGKRMRRLKGRFEETAMMKQANTRAFSTQAGEYGDDAMGKTLGLLDGGGSGALRKNTAEKRKVTYANTRASRKKAAQGSLAATAASNKNGLASSMVFTPVQGMELVNPDAARDRVQAANCKWFVDNAGFQSALPRK